MRVAFVLSVFVSLLSGAVSYKTAVPIHSFNNPVQKEDKVTGLDDGSSIAIPKTEPGICTVNEQDDYFGCIFKIEPQATPNEDWPEYLQRTLELDSLSVDSIPAGAYTVYAHFSIDSIGRISDVSITTDPGYGLGQRVMQAILYYKGEWKPGMGNGKPVKSYRMQPVTFIVEEEKECEDNSSPGLTLSP
jgi:hypothetical protein